MAFEAKYYEEIYAAIRDYILANPQATLKDFTTASNLNILISAIADSIEELYVNASVGWQVELKDAIYSAFNDFARKLSIKSSGTVTFARSTNAIQDYIIPIGTIVQTSDSVRFETTEEATLLAGTSSISSVSIQALEGGIDGNVGTATITRIVTQIAGIETVTNSAPTSGGMNLENDIDFENRFKNYILSLAGGTALKIKSVSESVDGVDAAFVTENFPISGTCTVYIDDGSGTADSILINKVWETLEGDGTEEFPGYRPCGITLQVTGITGIDVDVTAEIYISPYANFTTTREDVEARVSEYIEALVLGENVITSKIIDVIHDNTDVLKVNLIAPASDVVIANSEVAKVGTFTITAGT